MHICFEGCSGSGKTTQALLLTDSLNAIGIGAKYVKSPSCHTFGKKIEEAIHSETPLPVAEILAFAACYFQIVNGVIRPALEKGLWIVSDRGIGSSFAHALYRHRGAVSRDWFENLLSVFGGGSALYPDLTFFLSLQAELGYSRKAGSNDLSRLDDLNEGSLLEAMAIADLAAQFDWIGIDASRDAEIVAGDVWKEISGRCF